MNVAIGWNGRLLGYSDSESVLHNRSEGTSSQRSQGSPPIAMGDAPAPRRTRGDLSPSVAKTKISPLPNYGHLRLSFSCFGLCRAICRRCFHAIQRIAPSFAIAFQQHCSQRNFWAFDGVSISHRREVSGSFDSESLHQMLFCNILKKIVCGNAAVESARRSLSSWESGMRSALSHQLCVNDCA